MNGKGKGSKGKKEPNPQQASILKKASSGATGAEKKRSVHWDEMNIQATLHPVGKDYGHMKIDEPPTPYEREKPKDGAGVDPEALARRLEALALKQSGSDDEDQRRSRESFEKKRKMHYNEYLVAKKILSEMEDEDSDNDEPKPGSSGQPAGR